MSRERKISRRRREAGIALLISIFILLLISVVAIALIVSSGTESALTGNYRSSTTVYYAALAGVEEARARLRANDPNAFRKTNPTNFLPAPGTDLVACNPVYILNPATGEVVTPWDSSNPYYDTQYNQEFGATGVCTAGPWPPSPSPWTSSLWTINPQPFPAPAYKWVRINSITEQTLQLDVAPYDGTPSENKLIYYDGTRLTDTPIPGSQVLEITALAVLPNGSQRLLQYLVAPVPVAFPPFLAALTMVTKSGNNISYSSPSGNPGYIIKGLDQDTVGGCGPGLPVHAVGVFTNVDQSNFINGGGGGTGILPNTSRPNYTGMVSPGPDVQDISGSFPANLQTPAGIEALMQTIIQSADVVIPGPATGSNLPAAMYSPSPNPMTVVVNGNLDLSGWHNTGYGLLLVRGNLTYDPDASWNGIVMVVGQGTVTGSKGGVGEIDGAFFMATTLDALGNILSNLGKPSMIYGPNMGSNGIRYSSCWTQAAQPVGSIKILSFHEISQ